MQNGTNKFAASVRMEWLNDVLLSEGKLMQNKLCVVS